MMSMMNIEDERFVECNDCCWRGQEFELIYFQKCPICLSKNIAIDNEIDNENDMDSWYDYYNW